MEVLMVLLSVLFSFATVSAQTTINDIESIASKAIRPESPVIGSAFFPASCGDCCNDSSAQDCRLIDIESLIEDLASDISALSVFDQTCCANTTSSLDVISSQLDVLADCACCQFTITQADIGAGDTYIITQPGIYCLAEDITFSTNGFAIQINTTLPEVTLDLGGHTITGTGTGSAVLVRNVANVAIIQNGAITGGGNGIEIDNSSRTTVRGVNISVPQFHGITIYNNSSGVFINDITVGNALLDGIHAVSSTIISVSNSKIVGNTGSGIYLDGAIQCTFENVLSFANSKYGFVIDSQTGPSLLITYTDCNAGANPLGGFVVTNGPGMLSAVIKYTRCLSSNFSIGGDGFALINNAGDIDSIEYIECTALSANNGFSTGSGSSGSIPKHIVYDSCIAQANTGDGFFIDCTGVILRYCIAERNDGNGITLNASSINCQVLSCTASENGNVGITDTGTANLVHANTALGNSANYSPAVPLVLKPTDITGYWINVDPTASTIGEYESKIDSLLTCCDFTASSIVALADCSCCPNKITNTDIAGGDTYIIERPGIYCLAEDVRFSTSGFAIQIKDTAAQVVLDLQGHTITGSGGGAGIFVADNTGGVIIQNGTVVATEIGVRTENCVNTLIQNMNMYGCTLAGCLDKTSVGLTIKDVNVQGLNTGANGLVLIITTMLTLQNIEVGFVLENALYLDAITNGIFNNVNTFTAGGSGFFINSTDGVLSGLVFDNCKTDSNRGAGFSVHALNTFGIDSISFRNCIATNSQLVGFDILTDPSNINPITNITYDNCLSKNNGFGFYVVEDASNIIDVISFRECVAETSSRSGFLITGSSDKITNVVLENCIALASEGDGFYADAGIGHIFKGCTTTFANEGIYIAGGSDCQVLDCVSSNNRDNGILISTRQCLVQGCKSSNNATAGIAISVGSTNNQILNCYSSNNGGIGIDDTGTASYIHGNNATLNGGGNFNPAVIGIPISNTSPYWANVRDLLIP